MIADTTSANEYIRKGNVSFDANNLDSAIFYFNKSIEVLKPLNNHNIDQIADARKNIGVAYINQGKYNLAKEYFDQALPIYEYNHDSTGIGDCLNNIGVVCHYKGEYSESVRYYLKALEIREFSLGRLNQRVGYSYQNIGNAYNLLGKFELSLHYLQTGLEIQKELSGVNSLDVASIYNVLGIVTNKTGDYDKALEYHNKALSIKKKLAGENSEEVAESYINMAVVYKEKGDYSLALEYTKRAIDIYAKFYGANHPYIAGFYANAGILEQLLDNLPQAENYFMQTLTIYQAHFGSGYIKMAMLYENMGILEVEHDHYAKAYDYLKKSLAINLTNFGTDHPDVAQSYINLGDLFYTEGDPDQAMKNYEKALRIRKNIFQEKHPLIATTYNKMAQVQLLKNNFDAALQSCQLALIANIRDFQDSSSLVNPKINISFDDNILLESLHIKANTLAKESRVDQDQKKLDFSLQTYLLCADLIDKIRSSHLNFEDKIKMGEESTHIFESAIDVCYQLYHLTDHPDYLNSAFNLSERSRASVLRLALADISAKKFGGIPDSLLAFEKKIKNDITYYENKIQDAKENLYDSDTTKINNYSRHLFSRNRTYDSLIEAFERNYPKYYDLKYQNKLVDTDKLKQKLKEMQTTVVDYFLGDSALYTFVISDTNYVLLKNKISGNFPDQIKQYRKNISPNEILGDPQKVFSDFVANSRELYAMLIEPISQYIPADISHLTIIPSGILAIIPFESLLTNDHIPVKADYAHLPYLIRKFNISYAYSATLWSNQAKDVKQWKTQFAGYAPAYNTKLIGIVP